MNSQQIPDRLKKEKIRTVMREYKQGKLKSSSGQKVKNRKQALAIAFSEAERLLRRRKKGGKKQ